MNFRTLLFLTALYGVFAGFGIMIGGMSGLTWALVMSSIINFFSYFYSDSIVLRMYSAKQVTEETHPELVNMVTDLCENAQMPVPRIYIIREANANAFATGRNPENAAIAFTTGILSTLDAEELRAVAAHELSHVLNRDILINSIAATIAIAISYAADMIRWSLYFGGRRDDRNNNWGALLLGVIFAPIIATLIKLAISRSREFLADECGAQISHSPLALASALEKIHASPAMKGEESYARTSTAHLFISNPFKASFLLNLFSTHPTLQERVERLRKMAH
ncbi:protease HtpX [Candidatus Dependentiae bacterium]|nr:protease HtpX [Candidatus Dependentiae bacterium]